MAIAVLVHGEVLPEAGRLVWWAETSDVSGFSATADTLVELRGLTEETFRDLWEERGEDPATVEIRWELLAIEPLSPGAFVEQQGETKAAGPRVVEVLAAAAQVDVTAAFLCDWAESREGLLMAVAGGITRLWRTTYPSSMGASLAVLAAIPQNELDVPHDINVRLMGPDMQIGEIQGGFQIGRAPDLEVGETVVAPITFDLRPIELPAPGSYSLNISIDGEMKQAVSFIAKPPGTRPAGAPSP